MVVTPSTNSSEITNDVSSISLKSSNLNIHQAQRLQIQSDDKNLFAIHHFSNLIIYHQNIRGLSNKIDEVMNSFANVRPHIVCLTEHHLQADEIMTIYMDNYLLGSYFCRYRIKQGGVSIFISKDFIFQDIDLQMIVKEKDLEICALSTHISSINLLII